MKRILTYQIEENTTIEKIFKGKTGIFEEADQRIEVPGRWNPGEWKTEESD